jgi:hypothetical protein
MRDLPLAVPLEQSEYVGRPGIGTRQFARPAFDFQMNDSDALDDFDLFVRRDWNFAGSAAVSTLRFVHLGRSFSMAK